MVEPVDDCKCHG